MPNSFNSGYESSRETTTYADWVEASVLFLGESVSKADVRDYFYEENTFRRERSDEMVDDIWSELVRRCRLLRKRFPILPKGNHVERRYDWESCLAYSFCLLVSYAKGNSVWMKRYCNDYQEQGSIFEHVTADALQDIFPTWNVNRIGWSAETPTKLISCIDSICQQLGETTGNECPRVHDNDGAVDVLCYKSFPDSRGNYPVFFVQCSTGKDWVNKRGQQSLNLWRNWINFRAKQLLSRAFVVPFSLCEDAFVQTQLCVDGLVLDRIRLFALSRSEEKWLGNTARTRINVWLNQKIRTLTEK